MSSPILTTFFKELKDALTAIDNAYQANSREQLLFEVHKFHGGVSYIDEPDLKQATADLEIALKSNVADLSVLYANWLACVERVRAAYAAFNV